MPGARADYLPPPLALPKGSSYRWFSGQGPGAGTAHQALPRRREEGGVAGHRRRWGEGVSGFRSQCKGGRMCAAGLPQPQEAEGSREGGLRSQALSPPPAPSSPATGLSHASPAPQGASKGVLKLRAVGFPANRVKEARVALKRPLPASSEGAFGRNAPQPRFPPGLGGGGAGPWPPRPHALLSPQPAMWGLLAAQPARGEDPLPCLHLQRSAVRAASLLYLLKAASPSAWATTRCCCWPACTDPGARGHARPPPTWRRRARCCSAPAPRTLLGPGAAGGPPGTRAAGCTSRC